MYLSQDVFQEAVSKKRNGNYEGAIAIYRKEIKKMLNANDYEEYTDYARALAKCFYLNEQRQLALKCYQSILQHNILLYPRIVEDMKLGTFQFRNFAESWAPEIGYTLHDKDVDYYNAIAGKSNDKRDCYSSGNIGQAYYGSYDPAKYIKDGLSFITNELSNNCNHKSRFESLVNEILISKESNVTDKDLQRKLDELKLQQDEVSRQKAELLKLKEEINRQQKDLKNQIIMFDSEKKEYLEQKAALEHQIKEFSDTLSSRDTDFDFYRFDTCYCIRDMKEFELCLSKAENGNSKAQGIIADCYMDGHVVCKSDEKALFWAEKAANQGDALGEFIMGDYSRTVKGIGDPFDWYSKSAKKNNRFGQLRLGMAYKEGFIVTSSTTLAKFWLKKSAEQGVLDAQYELACILINSSYSTEEEKEEGLEWMKKAADLGHRYAVKSMNHINGNSSSCFLTTACIESKGLPDNCIELTTLRYYRDNILCKNEEGIKAIEYYYKIAPDIVKKVNMRQDARYIWNEVYNENIIPCVKYINNKEYDKTYDLYKRMVDKLEKL